MAFTVFTLGLTSVHLSLFLVFQSHLPSLHHKSQLPPSFSGQFTHALSPTGCIFPLIHLVTSQAYISCLSSRQFHDWLCPAHPAMWFHDSRRDSFKTFITIFVIHSWSCAIIVCTPLDKLRAPWRQVLGLLLFSISQSLVSIQWPGAT